MDAVVNPSPKPLPPLALDHAPAAAAEPLARPVRTPRAYQWPAAWGFALIHVGALGALWSGVTLESVVVCVVLYVARMFGITAGYHRYFAHKSFKTSRVFQFLLALLAQTSGQKGALWWAAHHRDHHRYSDQPGDVHSPRREGFWYAHMGWIFNGTDKVKWERIKDFARYPELVWLDRHERYVPWVLGAVVTLLFGWPGLFVGFFLSTAVLYHATFCINSLAHVLGTRRYETSDDSRNNFVLALLTLGEGWHNNHHYHQASARQGFRWWEIDLTYYALKVLSWLGIVWDIKEPPARVLEAGR